MILPRRTSGFTLLELLVVIGIIAVLSGTVMVAVNPVRQITGAENAGRAQRTNQLEKAIYQYLIQYSDMPGDKNIPEGELNAIPICRNGKVDVGCINLDEVAPPFIGCIPYDDAEDNPLYSGYSIYQSVGRPRIISMYFGTEEISGGGCETFPKPVGQWKLDEETIGTAVEEFNLFHGTHTNMSSAAPSTDTPPLSVSFPNPYSLEFDGINDHIIIPHDDQFNVTNDITAMGWVKGDGWGTNDDADIIIRKGEECDVVWELAIVNKKPTLILDACESSTPHTRVIQGDTTLATGEWYHIAAVWDTRQVRIYVNGQLDNTPADLTYTLSSDERDIYIGGREGVAAGNDHFDGKIDDVRMYSRALSPSQINLIVQGEA